uniref:Uncharacterized protein n=1 Tax=Schistocephalus solidus TaxID=70667 RepID=A0A0X3P2B4_SCHSO
MVTHKFTEFIAVSDETNASNVSCHCSREDFVPLLTHYISIRAPQRWKNSCYKTQVPFRTQLPEKDKAARKSAREIKERAQNSVWVSRRFLKEQSRKKTQHSESNAYGHEGETWLLDHSAMFSQGNVHRFPPGSEMSIVIKNHETRNQAGKEFSKTRLTHTEMRGKAVSRQDGGRDNSAVTIRSSDTLSLLSPHADSEDETYSAIGDKQVEKNNITEFAY